MSPIESLPLPIVLIHPFFSTGAFASTESTISPAPATGNLFYLFSLAIVDCCCCCAVTKEKGVKQRSIIVYWIPECVCLTGFTGIPSDGCVNIDDCLSNPCRNNGTCTDGINGFQCTCTRASDSTESIAAMKSTNVNRRHLVTTSQRASTESAITLVSARLDTKDGTVKRTWMNVNYRRPCAEFIRQRARTWWAIIDAFASPDGLAVIATWISTNAPTVRVSTTARASIN